MIDPFSGCDCIKAEELRAYYPEWASESDIGLSQRLASYSDEDMSTSSGESDQSNKDKGGVMDDMNQLFGIDEGSTEQLTQSSALFAVASILILSVQ